MINSLLIRLGVFFNRIQYYFPPAFDRFFVQLKYLLLFGKKINWKNPQTYTEKLNVYKISKQAETLAPLVDKTQVRIWIAKKIGAKYLVPLIGIYNHPDEINFKKLPNKFIIKANHGSGWIIICQDKKKLNWPKTKKQLNRWLKTSYYRLLKEKQYKTVNPKIIIEKFLADKKGETYDYKFFCFHGKVKFIQVDFDRYTHHTQNFYTPAWKKLPICRCFPCFQKPAVQPKNFKQMLKIATKLSKGFSHVRVDLYNLDGQIYFGEMTFTSFGGFSAFTPKKYDLIFGRYFKLGPEHRRQ